MNTIIEQGLDNARGHHDPRESAPTSARPDCLLLALQFACAHQGLPLSTAFLQQLIGHEGPMTVADALEWFPLVGLQGHYRQQTLVSIDTASFPLILKLKDESYQVLVGLQDEQYHLYDPVQGTESTYSLSGLNGIYGGFFLECLYSSEQYFAPSSAQQSAPQDWLWEAFAPHRTAFVYVLIGVALVNVFALASPLYSMVVFNRILPTGALPSLLALSVGLALIVLFEYIVRTLRAHLVEGSVKQMDLQIGNQLFSKVLSLRSESPQGIGVAGVASIMADYSKVRDFLTSSIILAFGDLPFCLLFVAVVWAIAGWSVAIWPLIGIALAAVIGVLVQRKIKHLNEAATGENARKTSLLYEVLGGLDTLKACAGENWARRHWSYLQQRSVELETHKRRLSIQLGNTSNLVRGVVYLAVVCSAVLLIVEQRMSAGALIAIIMLSMRAIGPITQIAQLSNAFHQAATAKTNIDRLMEPAVTEPTRRHAIRIPSVQGRITLRGVELSYPDRNTPLFRHLDLEIKPGERVGIVGKIGSGKSSLLKLCLGLCEPTAGSVMVDNLDIQGVDVSDMRKHIGYVSQELALFSGTLRSNIVMRKPSASDSELIEAIEVSGLQRVMADNETLLEQMLDAKSRILSGGQRQTAVLARALIGRPPILLMDEPTSLLDNVSERRFIKAFSQYLVDQTLIIVTHRQSMLSLVDRVIVLEQGKIAMDLPKAEFLKSMAS